jgi:hypothetical protein
MQMQLVQIRRALGWQGLIGLALVAAALLVDFRLTQPLEKRLRTAETALSVQARKSLGAMSGASLDISRFQGYFRDGGDVTGSLAVMYDIAEEKGLAINSAEYSVKEEKELGLEGYEIVFPVTGSYAKIREFAQTVLDQLPVASLDLLRLSRKRVSDVTVDAELRFTFYHMAR